MSKNMNLNETKRGECYKCHMEKDLFPLALPDGVRYYCWECIVEYCQRLECAFSCSNDEPNGGRSYADINKT